MEKKLLSLKNNRLFFTTFFLVGLYFIFGLQLFGVTNPFAGFVLAADTDITATALTVTPARDGTGNVTISFDLNDTTTTPRTLNASVQFYPNTVGCVAGGGQSMAFLNSISSDFGSPMVTNSPAQGTSNVLNVTTVSATNTITVNWLSTSSTATTTQGGGIGTSAGDYCILVLPGYQATVGVAASTTVSLDNTVPTTPSALTVNTTSSASVILGLPSTTSTDTNFLTYKIYYKAGSSGVGTGDTLFSTSTTPGDTNFDNSNFNNAVTTTITGLATGTQYVANIWAYDTYGNSTTAASELTFYTLADTPGTITTNGVTANGINLTLNFATNDALSATTTYNICKTDNGTSCAAGGYWNLNTTLGSGPNWYTADQMSQGFPSVGSLTPSTSYQFIVQAKNGDGVLTAFSTASTVTTTLSAQPVSPTVVAITTSTLTLSWGDNNNPASVEYRVSGTGITTTSTITTSSLLLEGLTPNAPFTIGIESKNSDGTYNAAVSTTLTYTSSTNPISLTVVSSSTTSMVLQWNTNGSATSTVYQITGNNSFVSAYATSTNTNQTVSTTVSGLTPNTSYTFNIASKNNQDNSYNTTSSFAANYTLANPAGAPTASSPATTTIALSLDANSNPAATTYAIYNSTTGNYLDSAGAATTTAVYQTTSTWSGITATGLTANTSYQFTAIARNGDGVNAATSSASTAVYTLANAAGAPTASSPATTTIALSLDANSNPAATTYAIYNSTTGNYLDSAGAATTTAVYQTTSTWSGIAATGLTANTSYIFTAIARNGDSVNAATSSASTAVYTLANPAGAPTASSPATTTIALSLNANSNPAATTYAIYNSTAGNYLDSAGAATTTAVYQTTSTWSGITATGLSVNTAYQFTVIARNGNNTNAATSSASTAVYTLANAAGTPTASSPAITTIALSLNANSNPAATTYAIYNSTASRYLDSAGAATTTAVYQTTSTWSGITATGLTANTSYQFTAIARNGDNVNAATSSTSTAVYTLANVPSSVAASASGNTITVTFAGDATSYYVVDNSDSARYSDFTTTLSRDFTGLTCNTSYTFKVKGKNAADTETAYSSTVSATTGACAGGGGVSSSVAPSLPAPAPTAPAIAIAISLTLNTPTPVSVGGVSHTVTVSSASANQVTLTIQSEPIKLTLIKGESKDIDTNKDSINDARITYLGLVNGKPKVEIVNLTDPNETKAAVSINAGAYETSDPAVIINLNGTSIAQIAISNEPSFANTSFIPYTPTVKWSLTTGNGSKTVYVKFRSKDGGTSMANDTIILNVLGGAMAVTIPTPTASATTYKFTKSLYVGNTGTAVKELQKLLEQLGYYTAKTITGKYDAHTKAAVVKFQKAKNLKPYPGFVGPGTVKALNTLTTISNASPTAITAVTMATTYKFTKSLYVGNTGTAVKELQKLLEQLGYYTAKTITGKYDAHTKAAVVKFQKAKKLKPYPGWVGPGTVKALNSL